MGSIREICGFPDDKLMKSNQIGKNGELAAKKLFKAFSVEFVVRSDLKIELNGKSAFVEVKNLNSASKEQRYQINDWNQKNEFVSYYVFLKDDELFSVCSKKAVKALIAGKKGKRIKISAKKVKSASDLTINEIERSMS